MSETEKIQYKPIRFREYDARWLYKKDINKAGIENLGSRFRNTNIKHTKKKIQE